MLNEINQEINKVNEIIKNAKKQKRLLIEKDIGMTVKEKFIIDFSDMPMIVFCVLNSMICSISLTYWYLNIVNNINDFINQQNFNMSIFNKIIFSHMVISISFFMIIFFISVLVFAIYGYGYHLRKTKEKK